MGGDGETGLLCCGRECAVWAVLCADSRLQTRSQRAAETESAALVDGHVCAAVYAARTISLALVVGLHVQHGCECSGWHRVECALERLQLCSVQADWPDVGGLAGNLRGLDHHGYEPGVVGFPALDGHG